jgi:hypothetical protein
VAARFALVIGALACAGCPQPDAPAIDGDPISHLPKYEEQRAILCARGREDAVTAVFCGSAPPDIGSLAELQEALGLGFHPDRQPGFSLTTNSSSLSARAVSSINPRAIFVDSPGNRADGNFVSMGFVRGDHTVEMAVRPPSGDTALYLVRYEQSCHESESGCDFADRLTPRTETGWTRLSLYDEVDLQNSVLDCLVCHQIGGPGTPVHFRMPEIINPWTHWMAGFGEGGVALVSDYGLSHGANETYAGIPPAIFLQSNPIIVENFVKESGSREPFEFLSQVIESEVQEGNADQPRDNSVPGKSATWDALYERAVRGEIPPPPYHDVKITDPVKLARMSVSYRLWKAGALPVLPDIRDVIRTDALADLSIRPKPGLSGKEILVHMCSQCHNGTLDQSVSRARFNAHDVDNLTPEMRDTVIDRLQRARGDRYKMPPEILRELSPDEIARVVAALP